MRQETKTVNDMPNRSSRIAVLTEGFTPTFSFVAIRGCELVGIAGFKTARGSLTGGISFRVLKTKLGLLGTLRAVLVLTLFQRKQIADQLLMD